MRCVCVCVCVTVQYNLVDSLKLDWGSRKSNILTKNGVPFSARKVATKQQNTQNFSPLNLVVPYNTYVPSY